MIENNYFFLAKYILKHRTKEECSCNLYINARNEEFQFICQKLYSREYQMAYSTLRKLTK